MEVFVYQVDHLTTDVVDVLVDTRTWNMDRLETALALAVVSIKIYIITGLRG